MKKLIILLFCLTAISTFGQNKVVVMKPVTMISFNDTNVIATKYDLDTLTVTGGTIDTTGLAPKVYVNTRDTLAIATLRSEYIAHDTLVKTGIRSEYVAHDTLVKTGLRTEYVNHDTLVKTGLRTEYVNHDTLVKTSLRTEYVNHDTLVKTGIRSEYIGHDTLVQQYARTRDALKVSKADSNLNGSYTSKKYVDDRKMVYPGSGVPISTGSGWSTSITGTNGHSLRYISGAWRSWPDSLSGETALNYYSKPDTLFSVGNSITYGYGLADPTNTCYPKLISNTIGAFCYNVAISGSHINLFTNLAHTAYPLDSTKNNKNKSVMLVGYNDMRSYGDGIDTINIFKRELFELSAYLAIPSKYKKEYAQAYKKTSGWHETTYEKCYYSNSTSDSISFKISGSSIYIGQFVTEDAGAIKIYVDGVLNSTVSQKMFGNYTLGGGTVKNWYGFTRISNLPDSTHLITIKPATTDTAYFHWISSNDVPRFNEVFVGNCLKQDATGYAEYLGSDNAVFEYNKAIQDVCNTLKSDGLPVYLVDVSAIIDPYKDYLADHIHPTEAGHVKIANVFLEKMNTYSQRWDNPLSYNKYRNDVTFPGTVNAANLNLSNITLNNGDDCFPLVIDASNNVRYSSTGTTNAIDNQEINNTIANGKAMNFDGINDYVSLGTSTQLDLGTGDGTYFVRFLNDGNDGAANFFYDVYDGTTSDRFSFSINTSGALNSYIYEGTTSGKTVAGTTDIGADSKVHSAAYSITRNSATGLKLYLDGKEESYTTQESIAGYAGNFASTGTKYLGIAYDGSSAPFKGSIYNFKYFNCALTAAEIKNLSEGGSTPYYYTGASNTALTSGTLVIGKKYLIKTYVSNDDFTNVGAASNAAGVSFIATGTTPTTWTNSSNLLSQGEILSLDPAGMSTATWFDQSGNSIDGTVNGSVLYNAPKYVNMNPLIFNGTDTTGVGSTSKIGAMQYYNGHFYGLIAGSPPIWKQLDN